MKNGVGFLLRFYVVVMLSVCCVTVVQYYVSCSAFYVILQYLNLFSRPTSVSDV